MKNLVLKTVAITVTAIIVILAGAYLILALAFPKTLAEGYDAIGSYSLSVKYYEKQYNKSGDIADLAALCVKSDVKADASRAVKYLAELTESEDFSAYCEREDKNGGFKMTAYEFYYGRYTVATFFESGVAAAITVAEKAVSAGYTENDAFYILLLDAETLSASDGIAVKAAITGIKSRLTDATEQGYAERDIALADGLQ